ncbi:tetratricopeptide repeat protein [candidate division KSB1 bacterium]|nr:tetratricopeptide repeat protein [candidate division KSB1 bacterium]
MHLLLGAPIATVVLIAIVIILIYLYKTSELLNRNRLRIAIFITIIAAIILNVFLIIVRRPPVQKFKLAVLPFVVDQSLQAENHWMQFAIPEIIGTTLQRNYQPETVVATLEWTYHALAIDLLSDNGYMARLFKRMPFSHFLTGHVYGSSDSLVIFYEIRSHDGKKTNGEISGSIPGLTDLVRNVTATIDEQLPDATTKKSASVFPYSPDQLRWYFSGYKYFLDTEYQDALLYYRNIPSKIISFPEARLLIARCLFQVGLKERQSGKKDRETAYFTQAKSIAQQVVQEDTLLDDAHRLLGEYYIYSERWSLADFHLREGFQRNPLNYRLYHPLSRLNVERFSGLGFSSERTLYERAIYINPCYTDGYIALSDILLFENKREQAIDMLNTYLAIDPNSVPALMALGKIYIVRNEMLPIMDILTKVIKLDPTNTDAYFNLGILYYNSNDIDNAKRFFEKAIEIDNHLNSHLYLAYINELRGDMENAVNELRLRIRYKTGPDDEFAEEARKHLYKIMHPDEFKDKQ